MDYIKILTQAAVKLWKHKIIPVYFLATYAAPITVLMLGGFGVFAFAFDTNNPETFFRFWSDIVNFENPLALLGIAGAYLFIGLFSYACLIFGVTGVIKGVALAENETEPISFGMLLQGSLKSFLPSLAIFFVSGIVLLFFMLPVIILGPLFALAICCLIPIAVFGRTAIEMLIASVVIEESGLLPALKRTWDIFQKNLGPLALVTIILLVIEFVANLVVTMPISVLQQIGMRFFVLNPATHDPQALFGQTFTLMFVMMLCFAPIMQIISSLITTYHLSATALVYLDLSKKSTQPVVPVEVTAADL